MSNEVREEAADDYVERLKRARKSAAVLKIKLAYIRSHSPDLLIFAFEGDDDKIVYSQWVRRCLPEVRYEPFPCGGKRWVLELFDVINRDQTNIGEGVFFFVDRDFDDLAGRNPDPRLFMTNMYSVENYLVDGRVLDDLLKNEFHCHGDIRIRADILDVFSRCYAEFLNVTREINRRIYAAKRLQIGIRCHLPDRPAKLALIEVDEVKPLDCAPAEIVPLEREPTSDEWSAIDRIFESLTPEERYRGKFALLFFLQWLDRLREEYTSGKKGTFGSISRSSKVRVGEFGLNSLSSRSALPEGLNEFLVANVQSFQASANRS